MIMTFAQPLWFLAGLLSCIGLAFVFHLIQKKRLAQLEKFAGVQLIGRLTKNVSRKKRRYKNSLIVLSVFLLFAALARPQYGSQWIEVKRKGIDLLFALDTSKSMLAEDIKPNRLKRAHFAILDFVQRLEGDRVGLLPFAGSSFLMCPLTTDYEAFEQSLSAVTTDIIPRGGTNIAGVIEAAASILTNSANHKILIILTDGENLEGDAIAAAEKYGKDGLTIYTVGVGTSGGELIPLTGEIKGFVKDDSGKYVKSRLDEGTLKKLAELTGGIYAPLGGAGEGLEAIYQQKLSLIPKEELAERRHKVPIDRFEWPLAGALLLLVLELLLSERKGNGQRPLFTTFTNSLKRKKEISTLAVLLLFAATLRAQASPGEDAFAAGDYLGASEYYSKQLKISPDSPELQYNYGVSSYKNNMYDDAVEAFGKALNSEDLELQKKAYFNLANSHYQKGEESLQGDPKATMEEWKQAISAIESVLKLAPGDEKAENNLQTIKKRLEELEKQKQEQDKNQEQNQQNQQDQQGQGDKQKQDGQDKQKQDDVSQDDKHQQGESTENTPQDTGSDDKKEQPQASQGDDDKKQNPAKSEQNNQAEEAKDENKPDSSQAAQPINGTAEDDKSTQQQAEEQARQDVIRQQQGKMTKEEAERLLNALKNQEGELNFIPSGAADNETQKDW
jgi:Ca-activated chloride channel family protein